MLAIGILLALACPVCVRIRPVIWTSVNTSAHGVGRFARVLPRVEINAIAQTPDGYLWLGTDNGLFRFDGVRAVPWQPPGNQHLPPGRIFSLLAGRDGTLWIGAKGLASWKAGKLTEYPELAQQYIFALVEDHEGTIWASGLTDPSGKLCAIRNGNIQCYGEDGNSGSSESLNLYEDSKGTSGQECLSGSVAMETRPSETLSAAW